MPSCSTDPISDHSIQERRCTRLNTQNILLVKRCCKISILVPLLGVPRPHNPAHLAIQVTLLPPYGASSPIDHNPAVTQAIWIDSLKNAWTNIDIILAATFARINDLGLGRGTRSRVVDVDLSAADRVVIGVGWVVHYGCG